MEVDIYLGNKQNNSIENLKWVTKSENLKHSYDKGLNRVSNYQKKMTSLANRGSGYGASKLTEQDIPKIRSMRKNGMTHKKIADVFDVHRETIGNVLRGNTWTHV